MEIQEAVREGRRAISTLSRRSFLRFGRRGSIRTESEESETGTEQPFRRNAPNVLIKMIKIKKRFPEAFYNTPFKILLCDAAVPKEGFLQNMRFCVCCSG